MMAAAPGGVAMWVVFAVIVAAIVLYAWEWLALEFTSAVVIAALLLFFHFFPVPGDGGANLLDAARLLAGFADPALIAVLSMLVIGQGLVQTGALQRIARAIGALSRRRGRLAIALVLALAMALSGIANNTPIVVVFIPVLQALSERARQSPGKVMIPLSYAAILGGMTTLIGSSTNLLVSGALSEMGEEPFSMFSFTVPGLLAAVIGLAYLVFVAPRLLPVRDAGAPAGGSGRHYLAQLAIGGESQLVGQAARAGMFPALADITVQMVERGRRTLRAPFEDVVLAAGDSLVVAGTRKTLTELLARNRGLAGGAEAPAEAASATGGEAMLVEIMVAPASRLIGHSLERIGFRRRYGCTVLGLQRRSRMIRQRVADIRLEAGDVLLVRGPRADLRALRADPDLLVMEWSAAEVPNLHLARRALAVAAATVAAISFNLAPVAIVAMLGAVAMLAAGCLNLRQARRAIDHRVVMLVAAALAMGHAMQATGGAALLAALAASAGGGDPALLLSAFFLTVALVTNVLSNNAAAVLFAPIAVNLAHGVGADPLPFAIAVAIAANCSFATPIGYQTNLLVMTPGQYRFGDFLRTGLPLVFLIWLAFSLFAPLYWGL